MDNFTYGKKMKDFLTILIQVELKWLQQYPRRNVNAADNSLFSDVTKAEVTAVQAVITLIESRRLVTATSEYPNMVSACLF
jgi:hypothetical protein